MATIEREKSVPVVIREKAAQAAIYRDHCRDLRRSYDRDAAAREAAHRQLVDDGTGPVDASEVLRLQKSRWNTIEQNEAALLKLAKELQETRDHLDDEYRLCGQMIAEYRDAEVQRLVDDFGVRPGDARPRIDNGEPLAQLRREAFRITELSADLARMLKAANEEIEAITAKKSQLSKSWRAF